MFRRILNKDKKKRNLINIFLIILVILLAFTGVAYSLLSEKLDITGKVTIKNEQPANTSFDFDYVITDEWYNSFNHYYNITFNIINNGSTNTTGWEVYMDVPTDVTGVDCWKATTSVSSTRVKFTNLSYNGTILPNTRTDIGFILNTKRNNSYKPANVVIKIYTIEKPSGVEIPIVNTQTPDGPDDPDDPGDPGNPGEPNLSPYIKVEFVPTGSWADSGQYVTQFNAIVTNISTERVTDWEMELGNVDKFTLTQYWNVNYVLTGTVLHLSNAPHNANINPGQNVQFGGMFKSSTQNYVPTIISTKANIKK